MGHVIAHRHGPVGGFAGAGVVGNGDVAKAEGAAGIRSRRTRGGAVCCGRQILFGPAEDVCGGGFVAEVAIQTGNACIITGQYRQFGRSEAQMVERCINGAPCQCGKVCILPAAVFDQDVDVVWQMSEPGASPRTPGVYLAK